MKLARFRSALLWFAPAVLTAGCSSLSEVRMPDVASAVTPYRIDIRQGNFVNQDMVAQLRPGMTRDQVRFILGTPLVMDVFHADRWDYIYRFRPGSGEPQQRRLAVFFEDGKLVRVDGDVVGATAGEAEAARKATVPLRVIEIGAEPAGQPAAAESASAAEEGARKPE